MSNVGCRQKITVHTVVCITTYMYVYIYIMYIYMYRYTTVFGFKGIDIAVETYAYLVALIWKHFFSNTSFVVILSP